MIQDFNPQGLVQDVAPYAVDPDAYTGMANMRVSGVGMEKARGVVQLYGAMSTPPKFGIALLHLGEVKLLYMGAGGVFVTNGTTHVDVSPTTGWRDFTAGSMTGGLFNGLAVFNEPGGAPWYWDGTLAVGGVKALPGWLAATVAQSVVPFNQHLFAGSLTNAAGSDPARLAWSDVSAPLTVPIAWTPTSANQAGEVILSTGAGQIQTMRGLGQQLMVYRTAGCFAVQYVGRPYIYTARRVAVETGAASKNAVAEVRGAHVILAPGDLVIVDGTAVRSIGEARVKSTIFSQVSDIGLKVSHVFATPGSGEVVFCFALKRDDVCDTAYVWDYERDKWSVRDLPLVSHSFATFTPRPSGTAPTWTTEAAEWNTVIGVWDAGFAGGQAPRAVGVSPINGKTWQLQYGDLGPDGLPVRSYAERIGLLLQGSGGVKLVTRVFPRISATPGTSILVTVGGQLGPSDPVSWSQSYPFIVGHDRYVDCLVSCRYLSMRFATELVATGWSVAGFMAEFTERGRA